MKVDIAIPAYNEEGNIGPLLADLLRTELESWFSIDAIYVFSDASTDGTDEIVSQAAQQDPRIRLVRKTERKGKWDSLNQAMQLSTADALILFDADVRLASDRAIANLLSPLSQGGVGLVGGNPITRKPTSRLNMAQQASYFAWLLLQEIKKRQGVDFYHAHGRVMALSPELYQGLVLPDSAADDQYIYFSCLTRGLKFAYSPDCPVWFTLPQTVPDYLKQTVRFRFAARQSEENFSKALVATEMQIPHRFRVLASSLLRHPYSGSIWALLYLMGKLKFIADRRRKQEVSGMWEATKGSP